MARGHEPNGHELILARPNTVQASVGGRKQAPSKAPDIPSAAGVCGTVSY